MDHVSEAIRMLEAFIDVGAYKFDVSRTTIDKLGIPGGYLANQSPLQLREELPFLLGDSLREQTNLIIHPHIHQPAGLLQLDDLNADMLGRLRSLAFLVISTSQVGRQAWVATEWCNDDFCRRVKRVAGADAGANGWVRMAGSMNIKRQYAPHFPTVQVIATLSRSKVGPEDFEALGLVAPVEAASVPRIAPRMNTRRPWAFPSYQLSLNRAPVTPAGKPNRSLVDFYWCCTCVRLGWSPAEAAAQLMKERLSKAYVRGERYATLTANKAAAEVAKDPR